MGESLLQLLRSSGSNVDLTTQRNKHRRGSIYLDLEDVANTGKSDIGKYDVAVLLASITSQEKCIDEEFYAKKINVTAQKVIAKQIIKSGGRIIFLSTNLVLGGHSPFLSVGESIKPAGFYAEFKAECESFFKELSSKDICILRVTKVLHRNLPLLKRWRAAAHQCQKVEAFSDLLISPVSLRHITNVLSLLINIDVGGIFHCSGTKEISYSEFAKKYLKCLGYSETLVKEIKGRILNDIAANSPPHSSLNSSINGEKIGIFNQCLDDLIFDLK